MATLQKTYTGDLSTAIAGKLYEAITDADEKNQLEKSNASQDVKQAAVKAKKEDPDSVPVRDMDLRKTIVNFFTPIEGKLIKAQLTYNNISSKVTALAGGVADTQKLLINQNQILEDKFDQILDVIGTKNAIEAKLKAENDFKQLELNLEKGLDLSGTFAYDKAGGRSNFGILGSKSEETDYRRTFFGCDSGFYSAAETKTKNIVTRGSGNFEETCSVGINDEGDFGSLSNQFYYTDCGEVCVEVSFSLYRENYNLNADNFGEFSEKLFGAIRNTVSGSGDGSMEFLSDYKS